MKQINVWKVWIKYLIINFYINIKGLETMEMLESKLNNSQKQQQKEKYEFEMKKEIKKL